MTIATTTATQSLTVDGVGPVDVSFTERGAGRPFLMLHGGAGPPSASGFADLLAESEDVRVTTPTPPGSSGTPPPEALDPTRRQALLYVAAFDHALLTHVSVLGTSIRG